MEIDEHCKNIFYHYKKKILKYKTYYYINPWLVYIDVNICLYTLKDKKEQRLRIANMNYNEKCSYICRHQFVLYRFLLCFLNFTPFLTSTVSFIFRQFFNKVIVSFGIA